MRHGIVEGEPGAFPDPVARLLRKLGNLFRPKKDKDREPLPTEDGPARAG